MTLFKILLALHIICGGISLFYGAFIMFSKKGDKKHKKIGNVYFYAMLSTSVLAIVMSYLHPNYFLFIIAIFTIYMILSGKRYLEKKKTSNVKSLDWIVTVSMFIFGLIFIAYGIFAIVKNDNFGIVLIVFGSISILFVVQDYRNFKGLSTIKNFWLTTHLQRMVGSYIAAITAFIVVNNSILPEIVAWLLPTVFLVPLITIWRRKYQVLRVRKLTDAS
ncbi:hypothetical protein [Aquiflexum lacus]|uniref:hypothetical protein n=1 Tax=Aquiflexum lacus TaxID=2483805 RepID=UPI0018930267|nr:hypothetical protein [Aquiflexum lacus]